MNKIYMIYDDNKNELGMTCVWQKAIEILENNRQGFIEVINLNTGNVDEIIHYKEIYYVGSENRR